MRRVIPVLALLLTGCAGEVYTFSRTPASIEVGATYMRPDQDLANAAQAHCRQSGRDAVQVSRQDRVIMPNWLDGRTVVYHCRS